MATPGESPTISIHASSWETGRDALVVAIRGRIRPKDVTRLCDDVCNRLQASRATRIVCDLTEAAASDAVAVDALARLQLGARRQGRNVELRNASPDLIDLVKLMGLEEALPAI